MLRISLAAVREGPVAIADQVAPDDPLVAATALTLRTVVRAECRRCLAPVDVPIAESLGLVFVEEEEAEGDEDCYLVPRRASFLDLSEAVREELLLAAPQFVECREDCRGLCRRCGADLNAGPCGCAPEVDPRWEALTKSHREE
jgi:uncharacterized protein